MPDKNPNLELWNQLAPVDRKFVKPITGKSYKGDSPNPTYVIRKITEHLGRIGDRWGFNVKFDRVRYGRPHSIMTKQHIEYGPPSMSQGQDTTAPAVGPVLAKTAEWEIIREEYHEVCIEFWFQDGTERTTFDAYGGTPMLYMTKSGNWMHDEDAAKKSLTDAYTKAASWLGACADIFLGIYDSKYVAPPDEPEQKKDAKSAPETSGPSNEQSGPRKTSAPADW